jgi:2-methylfumaryl-CoA hydratase
MSAGRFFEDFQLGEQLVHATPRTVSEGDVAFYQALYGSRFLPQSSRPAACAMGYKDRPLDDWLVFHLVFGKSVPDLSINAVANLGYAEGRFLAPVYCGDTLSAVSTIIGLRQTGAGDAGLVYARTEGFNQDGLPVLSYCRWVMVRKANPALPALETVVPDLAAAVAAEDLVAPPRNFATFDPALAGGQAYWDDIAVGQVFDHKDGTTLEDAEHMLATRLYQNTARVHFDGQNQAATRFGKRLVYGGHIISHARSMSFNGLANGFAIAALNGGKHRAPCFAGDTIYAASHILDKQPCTGREDIGALRVQQFVSKNQYLDDIQDMDDNPNIVLELDFWLWMPRR